ncbi:MAG: helix-turn-helix domain-containing protein [Rhizobiaceae bacterium]|nr:helix-turn-helix domain-containing protein [Rhizobiaceae bacterium]
MPEDLFDAATDVVRAIAQGSADGDFRDAMKRVEAAALREGRGTDFVAFQAAVDTLSQALGSSVTAENALTLLIETTHDLSRTLELRDLLRTIVTRARSLVAANVAWVTVLDDESGVFRTVNAEGHLSPATTAMKSYTDYGAVSLIMKTKSVFETQDYLGDRRFQHLPELDRVFETENIVSLAGFPMLADDEVHGFLFVADRYPRKLSGREISVLGSFALHAGLAMRNVNAFRQLSEALDEAQRSRTALIDHIQRVEASAAVHDEMTSLLASGADLKRFLQRMAGQIGGAIFLYDDQLRIREEFASASYRGTLAGDLRRGGVDAGLLAAASAKARHTGRSVVVVTAGDEQCRAVTLHGSTGRGESLVLCHQGELSDIEIRNFERNSVALSIAKLWNEKRETEKLIASSTLLRHLVLVSPPDPATLSAVRDRLALGAEQPVMLCLVAIGGLDRAAQTEAIRACAAGVNLLVDLLDDSYLAVGPEAELRAFLQKLEKSRAGWEAGGLRSEAFADLASAPQHFARIKQSLQILRKMTPLDRFVDQSEVNLFAKLFEAGDAARIQRYMDDLLAAFDAPSVRQPAQLRQTLLCYFDSQYNLSRVADVLGLHVNTVRQRLDTLRDLTGGWDDPVRALELHVALRLAAITGRLG